MGVDVEKTFVFFLAIAAVWVLALVAGLGTALYIAGRFLGVF